MPNDFASLPPDLRILLQSRSLSRLITHLRDRSDAVSNMNLMAVSGFCRNCLAKWIVLACRRRRTEFGAATGRLLDAVGYLEAAEFVHGEQIGEWKKRYQKKATEEELGRYEAAAGLRAAHDKSLLEATAASDEGGDSYRRTIPATVRTILEADAFGSLLAHCSERSAAVSNMAVMAVGGFCRNCLAKWLVASAREIAKHPDHVEAATAARLHALGYEEAAEFVYGEPIGTWKARYQTKATEEQLTAYTASKHLHAVHDAALLATTDRGTQAADGGAAPAVAAPRPPAVAAAPVPPSDVCCEDVDAVAAADSCRAPPSSAPAVPRPPSVAARPFVPPPPPPSPAPLRIGLLTVSDRAHAQQYATGDLGGPAVAAAVQHYAPSCPSDVGVIRRAVVPDEAADIATTLRAWSSTDCNLIFTTGGTGFAKRDVTPEATASVLELEWRHLLAWAGMGVKGDHMMLSRGVAGIAEGGRCIVVNLPGRPEGAQEVARILLPVLLHAVTEIEGED